MEDEAERRKHLLLRDAVTKKRLLLHDIHCQEAPAVAAAFRHASSIKATSVAILSVDVENRRPQLELLIGSLDHLVGGVTKVSVSHVSNGGSIVAIMNQLGLPASLLSLHSFDMRRATIGPNILIPWLNELQFSTNLQEVNLVDTLSPDAEGTRAVLQYMASAAFTIPTVNLTGNRMIGLACGSSILRVASNTNISNLNVSNCDLTEFTARRLLNTLLARPDGRKLKSLSISNNGLASNLMGFLIAYLRMDPQLQKLYVLEDDVILQSPGAVPLFEATLDSNRSLRVLQFQTRVPWPIRMQQKLEANRGWTNVGPHVETVLDVPRSFLPSIIAQISGSPRMMEEMVMRLYPMWLQEPDEEAQEV